MTADRLQVIVPGSRCDCGLIGHVTHTVTKLRSGELHPDPYRRFACLCGRKWRATISKETLLPVAVKATPSP